MVRSATLSSAAVLLALAFGTPVHADIFTVGPAGTYAQLSFAIAAADAAAGDNHEIRLQAAEFTDKPFINYGGGKTLTISGGWNIAFSAQNGNPEATGFTLLPGDDARPFWLRVTDGRVELSNVALFGGDHTLDAGGLSLRASGVGEVVVRDCVVRDNTGRSGFSLAGGGIDIYADGAGQVHVSGCDVRGNSLEVGTSAVGGGVYAAASDTARVTLERNRIVGNRLRVLPGSTTPSIALDAAGMNAFAFSGSTVHVLHNHILDNVVEASDPAVVTAQGVGLEAFSGGAGGGTDATLVVRGNVIRGNVSEAVLGLRAHAYVSTGNDDTVDLGDTEITRGEGTAYGLFLMSHGSGSAVLDVSNITVADNDGVGLRGNDRFPITERGSFFNSIVTSNGAPAAMPAWLAQGNNLIDVPVAFAAPASGDYNLAAGSPAIDAGNATPPAGLGAVDAAGGARIAGAAVDIGAYEFGGLVLFGDGFE